MHYFLALIGSLQAVSAIAIVLIGRSTFHETTAAILFGFGCVCMGIADIIDRMSKEAKRREEAELIQRKAEHEARENARVKAYP